MNPLVLFLSIIGVLFWFAIFIFTGLYLVAGLGILLIPILGVYLPFAIGEEYGKAHENDVDDREPYDMKHPDLWP